MVTADPRRKASPAQSSPRWLSQRERVPWPERQASVPPAAFLTSWLTSLIFSISASLAKTMLNRLTACGHLDGFQHRSRVDALIEGNEKDRLKRLGGIVRISCHYFWRRRGECPGDCFSQRRRQVADFRPGGHGDAIFGGLGQAVDQLRIIFKGQGLGAQPAPGAGQGWLDLAPAHPQLPDRPMSPAAPSAD